MKLTKSRWILSDNNKETKSHWVYSDYNELLSLQWLQWVTEFTVTTMKETK